MKKHAVIVVQSSTHEARLAQADEGTNDKQINHSNTFTECNSVHCRSFNRAHVVRRLALVGEITHSRKLFANKVCAVRIRHRTSTD